MIAVSCYFVVVVLGDDGSDTGVVVVGSGGAVCVCVYFLSFDFAGLRLFLVLSRLQLTYLDWRFPSSTFCM